MTSAADTSTRLGAVDFVRLLRFVRLWKKLGWTIEQTDAAICALYRADLAPPTAADVDTPAKLDAGFLTLLPHLGIVVRALKALDLTVERDLLAVAGLLVRHRHAWRDRALPANVPQPGPAQARSRLRRQRLR